MTNRKQKRKPEPSPKPEAPKVQHSPGGIKGRWLVNSLSFVLVILAVVVILISVGVSGYYYATVRDNLASRAATTSDTFRKYFTDTYDQFYTQAEATVTTFQDQDKFEQQFLDANGRILLSTSGLSGGGVASTEDASQALSGQKTAVFTGRDPLSGERVMSVTAPLLSARGDLVGGVRYITSLRIVERQIWMIVGFSLLACLLFLMLVVASNSYFIRSIVDPVLKINTIAKEIAAGRYGVRLQKTYDDEIGELCDTINYMSDEISRAERMKNDFISSVSHELRTPLTLILGPLEDMQKDTSLPVKQAQKLSVIHQSALRLLNLINQILEFRKTETQNKRLCVCKGNIAPLIYEIGLKYKELNQKTKIDFRIQIEKEEMLLFFDKEIVTIVLDNLISNAIKYTEQGCITLSLYQTVRNEVAYTEIKVSDTGYGISAEALPHIFDRYYQESGKHQASGTGIGLALVKNLVELHEGEIRAESVQNEGSTFYISLLTDNIYPNALHADSTEPAAKEDTAQATISENTSEPTVDNGKPILLIVEDNEEIQKYIAESFSDSFEVITADNGEEGKQQALSHIPDIIVSDIMMPIMDGITLCRQLKEDVRTSHIPIILLTAKDSLQDKEEGYEVGADSYLTKPFSASLLRSRINNLLESRKKLITQFQAQPVSGNQTDLNEKRIIIAEALSKLDNEFIEKITLLIEENLSSEKIDITYLSDKMCMSGSTLYRKMKALTGLSTNEYIRKVKMQNAERLLLEGKFNISEIAYKVGMNSTGYFRQCFKEEFGVSPSDYLKQIKQV